MRYLRLTQLLAVSIMLILAASRFDLRSLAAG